MVDLFSGFANATIKSGPIPGLDRDFNFGGAARLPSGQVLFCGGAGATIYASCYFLDPVTLSLTDAPALPSPLEYIQGSMSTNGTDFFMVGEQEHHKNKNNNITHEQLVRRHKPSAPVQQQDWSLVDYGAYEAEKGL